MKTTFTLLLSLTFCNLFAQQTVLKWNQTSLLKIDYPNHEIVQTVEVVNDSIIKVDKLPEQLIVMFSNEGIGSESLQFNEKKEDKFTIALDCKSSSCEPFYLTDLVSGRLTLTFQEGNLIKIGNRTIGFRKVSIKKPVIKLLRPGGDKAEKKIAAETSLTPKITITPQPIGEVNDAKIREVVKCLTCNLELPALICCGDTKLNAKAIAPTDSAGGKLNRANSPGLSTNNGGKDSGRKRSTHTKHTKFQKQYRLTIDPLTGEEQWSYMNENKSWIQIPLSEVRPVANSNISVEVRGIDTATYSIEVNGESYFLQDGIKFQAALESFGGDQADSLTTKNINDGDTTEQSEQASPSLKKNAENYKAKLIALDKVLESFNGKHLSIDFNEANYQKDLLQLRENIKNCFSITLSDSATLEKTLRDYVAEAIAPPYRQQLLDLLKPIAPEYQKASTKTTHRTINYLISQVPDEDRMTIKVKQFKKIKVYRNIALG